MKSQITSILLIFGTFITVQGQNPILKILSDKLPNTTYGSKAVYDGDNTIYILGGWSQTDIYLNTVLEFTISAEKLEQVAILPTTVALGSAIYDGTGVVYFGGQIASGERVNNISRYTPGNNVAITAGKLPEPLAYATIQTINDFGDALIFGGIDQEDKNKIFRYSKNLAVELADRRLPQDAHEMASIHYSTSNEESVLLFGGLNCNLDCSSSPARLAEIVKYNIKTGESFILKERLPVPCSHADAVYNGTHAFILGGYNGNYNTGVVRFNPLTHEVTSLEVANFPEKLYGAGVAYVKKLNRAYIFGGRYNGTLSPNSIMYLQF